MAVTDAYKVVYRGQLSASVGSLYTPSTGKGAVLTHWKATNNDSVARTFTLYINGTTNAHVWWKSVALGPGESAEWDGVMPLNSSDELHGVASAASQVTLIVGGDEVTY